VYLYWPFSVDLLATTWQNSQEVCAERYRERNIIAHNGERSKRRHVHHASFASFERNRSTRSQRLQVIRMYTQLIIYYNVHYRGPSARHTWRAIYFPSHAERERMLCMSACIYGAQSTRHCTIVGWLASMLTWRHLFSLHDMHWLVSIPMATTEICAIFELPNKGIVFEHKLATLVDAVV